MNFKGYCNFFSHPPLFHGIVYYFLALRIFLKVRGNVNFSQGFVMEMSGELKISTL